MIKFSVSRTPVTCLKNVNLTVNAEKKQKIADKNWLSTRYNNIIYTCVSGKCYCRSVNHYGDFTSLTGA